MNCTGCIALRNPIKNGYCCAGIRTGVEKKQGRLVRHPLETCHRPKTDAELAERIEIIARENA